MVCLAVLPNPAVVLIDSAFIRKGRLDTTILQVDAYPFDGYECAGT
jgi:hypothetical protein